MQCVYIHNVNKLTKVSMRARQPFQKGSPSFCFLGSEIGGSSWDSDRWIRPRVHHHQDRERAQLFIPKFLPWRAGAN